MTTHHLPRRTVLALAAAPFVLGGCSTPLPLTDAPPHDRGAAHRVRQSAEAHGADAYRNITDINIAYEGKWRALVDTVQPDVVDAGFRGGSQERILTASSTVAQAYQGERGRKQVVWQRASAGATAGSDAGRIAVWRNGTPDTRAESLDAAALVAEGYGLFLLGPLWIDGRSLSMRLRGTERVDGRMCDVVEVWLRPGLGRVAMDRIALCIDQADHVMRRVRFTLEGTANTQGAVAEVDTFDHERRFGVLWPMRSYERVVHPIALPAHDWHIAGLDVNRGYSAADIAGPEFTGRAAAPAAPR